MYRFIHLLFYHQILVPNDTVQLSHMTDVMMTVLEVFYHSIDRWIMGMIAVKEGYS